MQMSREVPCTNSRLRSYSIIRQIGKGSYGEVYLVTVGDRKKQYVMKNIKLTSSSAKERLGAEQEAALLSHLHHPNIVAYKESFQDDGGVLHIVMGYCEGGDLHTRLKSYGNSFLPETQVVEWFVQIALALQYLHDRNILHRDLKTQNIFLSKNDIIKVGDLGIARVLDGSCDLAHTVIGTPYYMSPELFANQPYNHKSDIWALGCCVHEIASLKHAFSAHNINALMYKVIQGRVSPIPSHYSQELNLLVQQMLAQKAEVRPGVHEILRKPFIRKHIQMFLDRTAGRKRRGRFQMRQSSKKSVTKEENGSLPDHKDLPRKLPALAKIEKKEQIQKGNGDPVHFPPQHVGSGGQPLPHLDPTSEHTSCGEVVSSARQRRRMSKLQLEGHMKQVDSSERAEVDGGVKRDYSDGGCLCIDDGKSRESGPPVEGSSNVCADNTDELHMEGNTSTDGGQCIEGDRHCHIESSHDEDSDGGHQQHSGDDTNQGQKEQDWEVDDFYTLLDSTLHLSDVDVPSVPVSHKTCETLMPGELQLHSGRLAGRIRMLHKECELALGPAVVHQVMELLNRIDPEESQEELKLALGTDHFQAYAAKLEQLKLCQDSIAILYK